MPASTPPSPASSRTGSRTDAAPASLRLDVGALSHCGHVRAVNEDAYLVFRIGRYLERVMSNVPEAELPSRYEDSGYLMMVADGLGGQAAGEVASRSALVTTLQLILRSPRWGLKLDDPATREREIRDMLDRTRGYFAGVHETLRKQADQNPHLAGMSTTFTGAYMLGSDLFVLHVGDSKADLLREGLLSKITHDHTVAQEYADLGVIPQEEVAGHRHHHVLTRALGGPEPDTKADIHHLGVAGGDRLLLCSDGLTDMVSEGEIARVLGGAGTSEDACGALVDLALEHGGRDNVTVIVAGFRKE